MKRSVHNLMGSFLKAQEGLKNTAPDQLSAALEDYANRFSAFPWAADYLIRVGDDAMESGDRGTAFLYLDTAYRHFPSAGNKVTLYLRLAQYHLDAGNTEAGIQFLNLLCTATVDNYEESIECNNLTDVWNRCKHHLPDRTPPLSTKYESDTPSMRGTIRAPYPCVVFRPRSAIRRSHLREVGFCTFRIHLRGSAYPVRCPLSRPRPQQVPKLLPV